MATRTSIELHPDGCRVVEVVTRADASRDVVVRRFVAAAADGTDASTVTEALARLRRTHGLPRHAWVTIWGLRSTQQLLRLPPARDVDLKALAIREARKDIAALETGGDGATVVAVPGAEVQAGAQRRREVSLVAVSNADVRDHVQPVVDAGFIVDGIGTPALALAALARSRHNGLPGATAAYVAIGARATCLAIVRDGVLLFAREMAWGHSGSPGEAIETRTSAELKRSILYFKQTFRASVDTVVLCGDMPDQRAMTQPLGEALGVAVEALDSLVGVDAGAVPQPADVFRTHVAALRVAIAAGADVSPVANLLPMAILKGREARAERLRLTAAVVLGLLLASGWFYTVRNAAGRAHDEAAALESRVAALESAARHASERQRALSIAATQQAALQAFDGQGPRLGRLLEAVGRSAPETLAVTSIAADADGTEWRVEVAGVASAEDAAASHAAVTSFLSRMADSPYIGAPVLPPSIRVLPGGDAEPHSAALPAGRSGVEFTAVFVVKK